MKNKKINKVKQNLYFTSWMATHLRLVFYYCAGSALPVMSTVTPHEIEQGILLAALWLSRLPETKYHVCNASRECLVLSNSSHGFWILLFVNFWMHVVILAINMGQHCTLCTVCVFHDEACLCYLHFALMTGRLAWRTVVNSPSWMQATTVFMVSM